MLQLITLCQDNITVINITIVIKEIGINTKYFLQIND